MSRKQGLLVRAGLRLSLILVLTNMIWGLSDRNTDHVHASLLIKNDAEAKPFLGWSTWSFIGHNPTEANVEAQANVIHNKLQKYGFNYVLLDDFWYQNPSKTVDQFGHWVVDTSKFPHGLSGLASHVHGLGLKFGAYLTAGIPVAAVNQNTLIEGTQFHARDIADMSKKEKNYN